MLNTYIIAFCTRSVGHRIYIAGRADTLTMPVQGARQGQSKPVTIMVEGAQTLSVGMFILP